MQISNTTLAQTAIATGIALVFGCFGYNMGCAVSRHDGAKQATLNFQKDAIKQNVAQFDPLTGDWRWKTPEELASAVLPSLPKEKPVADQPEVITPTAPPPLPLPPPSEIEMDGLLPPKDLLEPAPAPKKISKR